MKALLIISILISSSISFAQDDFYKRKGLTFFYADSTFSDSGQLLSVVKTKQKCPSTNCRSVAVYTEYNEKGKVIAKKRTVVKSGCFHRNERTIILRGRKNFN